MGILCCVLIIALSASLLHITDLARANKNQMETITYLRDQLEYYQSKEENQSYDMVRDFCS